MYLLSGRWHLSLNDMRGLSRIRCIISKHMIPFHNLHLLPFCDDLVHQKMWRYASKDGMGLLNGIVIKDRHSSYICDTSAIGLNLSAMLFVIQHLIHCSGRFFINCIFTQENACNYAQTMLGEGQLKSDDIKIYNLAITPVAFAQWHLSSICDHLKNISIIQ